MNSQQMMEAFVNWANDQGLETRERIAAQAAWMAATDRLSLLCEAKDAAIQLAIDSANIQEVAHFQQLSEAQAQIAMMHEFQEGQWWVKELDSIPRGYLSDDAYRAISVVHNLLKTISATSETVAAWRAKEFGECTRSHPHELMSPMCKLRTEIARLTSHLATAQAETEPLRREVAMLVNAGKKMCEKLDSLQFNNQVDYEYVQLRDAMYLVQATSFAYERDVKAKALEEMQTLQYLRAANKGEVK